MVLYINKLAPLVQRSEYNVANVEIRVRVPGGALNLRSCVDSLMVMISAFQAEGPGSIPGRRIFLLDFAKFVVLNKFLKHFEISEIFCHVQQNMSVSKSFF